MAYYDLTQFLEDNFAGNIDEPVTTTQILQDITNTNAIVDVDSGESGYGTQITSISQNVDDLIEEVPFEDDEIYEIEDEPAVTQTTQPYTIVLEAFQSTQKPIAVIAPSQHNESIDLDGSVISSIHADLSQMTPTPQDPVSHRNAPLYDALNRPPSTSNTRNQLDDTLTELRQLTTPQASSQTSRLSTSTGPRPVFARKPAPRNYKTPNRRRLFNQNNADARPANLVLHAVPSYRSRIQQNQPYLTTNIRRYDTLTPQDAQSLSFVMGTSDTLPDLEVPENDENNDEETNAKEEALAKHVKAMIDKDGSVQAWEKIYDELWNVRYKYSEKDQDVFLADRLRVIPRIKNTYDSLKNRPTAFEFEETPAKLTKELKKHQKSGLKFMLWRETQDPLGGILADDMGLGKTATVVALVTATLGKTPPGKFSRPPGVRYSSDATLIVCPAGLTSQWKDEFAKFTNNYIRCFVHHTDTKAKKVEDFLLCHVVITSYAMVANEQRGGKTLLFGVLWKRIVLDEGHLIRNFKTNQAEACCELPGKIRWILTGTPVHNRIDDIYSYLIFLQCKPFDEREIFLKWGKDIKTKGPQRLNVMLKAMLIRRTKDELKMLPGNKVIEHFEYELTEAEMECYNRLMALSQSMMKIFLNYRARKNNGGDLYRSADVYKVQKAIQNRMKGIVTHSHIFVLLLRLRQLCQHPTLISSMLQNENSEKNNNNQEENAEEFEQEHVDVMGQIINDTLSEKDIFSHRNIIFNEDRASTKILVLMDVLQKKLLPTKDKALIVCEWPSYLRIVANYISLLGLSYEHYNGEVPMDERADIVHRFNSDAMCPRVLLLSLTCGGIGLNLAKATQIYMLSTHWNPQMEAQAEDRCYRIGQENDVFIYKFRAQGTIEERIYNLQQHKLKLADSILSGASSNNHRLTIQDLKTLFGI